MNTLMIDVDALRRARSCVEHALVILRKVRATSGGTIIAPEVGRALASMEEVSRRLGRVLTSPLLLDPPRRNAELTAIIDDWITDRKWWARSTTFESTPIDPLVRVLRVDAPTRDRLINSLVAHDTERLTALLFGPTDFSAVRELWIRATDPSKVDPERARIRIEAVARAIFAEPHEREVMSGARIDVVALERRRSDLRELLGMMAAPWVLHFTGLSTSWNGEPGSGRDLLARIAHHDEAAMHLRTALGPSIERAFRDLPSDHLTRMERIDHIAFAVGASTEILRNVDVEHARQETSTREAVLSIPGHLPLGLSWPAGLALGAATSMIAGRLDDTHDVEERSIRAEYDDRERLADIAQRSALRAAIEDGLMSPDGSSIPADVRVQVQHAHDAISNAADRGDAFAST